MVGSFSRVGLSLYTYVPPNQTGMFSDSGALNRAVQRPANAFDAFRRAAEEGLSGVWSGISGTLMDPTQVWHIWNVSIDQLGFHAVSMPHDSNVPSPFLSHLHCCRAVNIIS